MAPERRYEHLVRVRHPWRRQLSLKGRRMTVGQLIAQMTANDMTPEAACNAFEIPIEAVREATDYAERNRDLIASEAAEDRRRS